MIRESRREIDLQYIYSNILFINSAYGVDECADVCTVASTTNLTTLSNCTLTFTATVPGAWYAMALQVNDLIFIYITY
jgi:hypothetical protein